MAATNGYSKHPQAIFGGASIGDAFDTVDKVKPLLELLKSVHITRIDTAARYPPLKPGASETLLGEVGAAEGFTLDTKVNVFGDGSGTLTPENIEQSVSTSLSRIKKFSTLYCHAPDHQTPLEDQARGLNEQYKQGHFKELGVSNFSPEMLKEFLAICEKQGYVKPTVYQGQYNLICRKIEKTLFPTLRAHGMKFNAFSPLAGGFLTGKFSSGSTEGTRYANGNPIGNQYKNWYDKPEIHEATKKLHDTIEPLGINGPEAGLRWIFYHSILGEGDGVLLGASKLAQIQGNIDAMNKGPLPQEVVDVIEQVWEAMADVAP